jgi:hypothetical protein
VCAGVSVCVPARRGGPPLSRGVVRAQFREVKKTENRAAPKGFDTELARNTAFKLRGNILILNQSRLKKKKKHTIGQA